MNSQDFTHNYNYDNPHWAEVDYADADFAGTAELGQALHNDNPPVEAEGHAHTEFDNIPLLEPDPDTLEYVALFEAVDYAHTDLTGKSELGLGRGEMLQDTSDEFKDSAATGLRPAKEGRTGDGLVQKLAAALTEEESFARDSADVLYHFEGGLYQRIGERFVRQQTRRHLESWNQSKSWTPALATNVAKYIALEVPELWQRPPLDRLNTANGILDVRTLKLSPHSPDFLSPVQITPKYDPDATCPRIEEFVTDVFATDARHIAFQIPAWLMLPNTSIQKAVLTIGEGANGKSVFLALLNAFLGKRNVTTLSLHKMESDKFGVARLQGKLANICPDLPTAVLSGTSMFKALTGGDTITAEHKFATSFEFQNYARLVFSANCAPRSDDSTYGFFRRWLVVPFDRTFDTSDPKTVPREILDAQLASDQELSGFLNRALQFLPQIESGGFAESASTRSAMDEFRKATDPFGVWLDRNTIEAADAILPKEHLRGLYAQACQGSGRPILLESRFTSALKKLRSKVTTAERRVNGQVTKVFVGIQLTGGVVS